MNHRTDSSTSAASLYAQESIENAPPVKIVRIMYQGAIRFLDSASACDPCAPASKFQHWLARADEVVVELRLALEPGPAPEIARALSELYVFVEDAIRRARLEQSVEPLAPARTVLAKLLESWTAIDTGKA